MSNIYDIASQIEERHIAEQKIVSEKAEVLKEKQADRKSDRSFLWTVTLVSAIIGAIIGSVITIILERFLK